MKPLASLPLFSEGVTRNRAAESTHYQGVPGAREEM